MGSTSDFDFAVRGRALVHLGNSGRVDLERPPKQTRPRGSLVRFEFGDAALLVREHGTERRAGLWILAADDDGPLSTLGPEPNEPAFAELVLHGEDRRHLHTMLRDQRTVAGIGRGYADDALHRARLSPFASLSALDDEGRERLLGGVREVLDEALVAERQRSGRAVGRLARRPLRDPPSRRHALPAMRPAARARVAFSSNELVYCPDCQTGGRVLSDRRLSRLLR